jgi:hypothetical protein
MEPAKVSREGTQLEVASGEKLCKAACRIKNADLVTTDRPGGGKRDEVGLLLTYNYEMSIIAATGRHRAVGAGR